MRTLRRPIYIFALLLTLGFQQIASQTQSPQPNSYKFKPSTTQTKPGCTNNGTYVNNKGQTVKRPENCSAVPQGATAQCRDGSYSFSESRRGTRSHHGGVAKWL